MPRPAPIVQTSRLSLLPPAPLPGFTGGAAISIVLGQFPHLLGYRRRPPPDMHGWGDPVWSYFTNIEKAHPLTAALGLSFLALIMATKVRGMGGDW